MFSGKAAGTLLTAGALSFSLLGSAPAPVQAQANNSSTIVEVQARAQAGSIGTGTVGEAGTRPGKRYKINYKDSRGRAAHWNGCKPIRWAYNPKRQNANGFKHAKQSIRMIQKASGLRFKYVGKTKSVPFKGKSPGRIDVRIGWGNNKTHGKFFSSGSNVAGYGGFRYAYRVKSNGTRTPPEIIKGDLVMNTGPNLPAKIQKLLYMHELGHVVGLDHVKWKSEVMYPVIQPGHKIGFGKGDKAGLRKVGRPAGCFAYPIR